MSALQNIEVTRHALENALADGDWEAITALDLECRTCIDRVLDDQDVDKQKLRSNLEALLLLYRRLIDVTSSARENLASQMSQARQGHNAATIYHLAQKASMMR